MDNLHARQNCATTGKMHLRICTVAHITWRCFAPWDLHSIQKLTKLMQNSKRECTRTNTSEKNTNYIYKSHKPRCSLHVQVLGRVNEFVLQWGIVRHRQWKAVICTTSYYLFVWSASWMRRWDEKIPKGLVNYIDAELNNQVFKIFDIGTSDKLKGMAVGTRHNLVMKHNQFCKNVK